MHKFNSTVEYLAATQEHDLTRSCFMIKDYCLTWPLCREDFFDYISREYGEDEIFIEEDINTNRRITTVVSEYVARLMKKDARVLGNWSYQPHLIHANKLKQSFFIPQALELDAVTQSLMGSLTICPWLLMSAPSTTTSMHQDMLSVNGVVGQLSGSKIFTLVPPEYELCEDKYYPAEMLEALNVPYKEVVLHAGDFLYFPKRWWHQAKTLTLSATLIHSTVNQNNLEDFLNEAILEMPHFIQRIQLSAKKLGYFGNKIKWLSNGFRILEQ